MKKQTTVTPKKKSIDEQRSIWVMTAEPSKDPFGGQVVQSSVVREVLAATPPHAIKSKKYGDIDLEAVRLSLSCILD